ncbi:type I polyketide synthase [Streptomyces heilongjiangensis]
MSGLGGMVSVALPRDRVASLIRGVPGVSVAAVNGSFSTVISGDTAGLEKVLAVCESSGVRARRIDVDYASHSAQVELIREELLKLLDGITPCSSEIPFVSTVTGERIDTVELGAEYWYRNLRQTVEFQAGVETLLAQGHRVFLECSPHPVLTVGIEETAADRVVALESLRRDEGSLARLVTSAGEAWAHGVPVDWARMLPGGRRVDLPTYPFQYQHYWLDAPRDPAGDVSVVGLAEAGHALVPAAVDLPDGRRVWTGRLSLSSYPWLADHQVLGQVLVPGVAWAELALHAGHQTGFGSVEELTLQAPLVLGESDAVQVRVIVAEAEEPGRCAVSMHSRRDGGSWVTHAEGVLGPEAPAPEPLAEWPPTGATPLDTDGFYDELAAAGYHYGSGFRGLRRAWRAGEDLLAEIALPESADATGYGLHPGLFDAAVHSVACARTSTGGEEGTRLPFAFSDVRLFATGATSLRVRISPPDSSWQAWDDSGLPVLTIGRLVSRPVEADQFAVRRAGCLFRVDRRQEAPAGPAPASWAVVGADPGGLAAGLEATGAHVTTAAGLGDIVAVPDAVLLPLPGIRDAADPGDVPTAVRAATAHVLGVVQDWLTDDRFCDGRLVAVSRGAGDGDLVHGTLRGLLRAAQTEHPDRLTLVDLDEHPASLAALPGYALGPEPEVVVRAGDGTVPRLVRAQTPAGTDSLGTGTVLITGGTGTLGGLLARHLVQTHGVTRLLLVSRRGPAADGADRLRAELTERGAHVDIVAADLADRATVAALLSAVDADHPLSAVVHAAGALDDGVLGTRSAEWLDPVLRPKADAAWHLHELTAGMPLTAFVMFSSAASVLGAAGQANYAAANGFLDALAAHRTAQGLPGISLAWGLWEHRSELTRQVGSPSRSIAAVGALSTAEALAAFDAALAAGEPLAVPIRLEPASTEDVPPMLRGLVQVRRRTVTGAEHAQTAGEGQAARQLAGLGAEERQRHVRQIVLDAAAAVLGHDSRDAIPLTRGFLELGFDSLTAVRLRNRLSRQLGLRLSATAVFDHPSPAALAAHLLEQLVGTVDPTTQALQQLESLRRSVNGAATDGLDRALVAQRLAALLDELRQPDGPDGRADPGDDLENATADEIYAYIDNELGIGGAQ